MKTLDFLKVLDRARSDIRKENPTLKGDIAPHCITLEMLQVFMDEANMVTAPSVILEAGQPKAATTADFAELFAILPADEEHMDETTVRALNRAAPRHTTKAPEMRATVLPRETKHVNQTPDIIDADESTVARSNNAGRE